MAAVSHANHGARGKFCGLKGIEKRQESNSARLPIAGQPLCPLVKPIACTAVTVPTSSATKGVGTPFKTESV